MTSTYSQNLLAASLPKFCSSENSFVSFYQPRSIKNNVDQFSSDLARGASSSKITAQEKKRAVS